MTAPTADRVRDPVLLAAGAEPTLRWVRAGGSAFRRTLLGVAVALSAVVSALLMLPFVPVQHLAATPIPDINYDAGETVGWPSFVRTVAEVYEGLPPTDRASAAVLTRNYGEAGAVDRFGAALGLPPAYSGHNSYALWGPPPETARAAVVVGYDRATLARWCGSVEQAARIDNGVGLDNNEQGTPVWVCRERSLPWAEIWPQLRRVR